MAMVNVHCVQKKTPIQVCFYISEEMFRFPQNFQAMFRRLQLFQRWKTSIFFATGEVMLMSYFRVCKLWVLALKIDVR